METIYNTFVEKIASRSISFFSNKCSMMTEPSTEDKSEHNLQRLLLRARIIVEEADGRDITNQAMVHQLNILRKEMYRGYYTLDNIRYQQREQTTFNDQGVSRSFALSKFNSAKRFFLSSSNTHKKEELEQVHDNLHSIINDMNEFKTFLKNYSPLYRQPYSMHLFLDKCMFARQMEIERIMNFLVRAELSSAESVGILPIVGPPAVGKSTLVSHVCSDERVRNLFSLILMVTEDDLKDRSLNTSLDSRVVSHQNNASNGNEAMLLIIELPKDIDEGTWKSVCSIFVGRIARGSKIIITSRSSKITDFGTTQAVVLNYLSREAFWYFFKVITFGSADPEEQPKLASMAMEIGMGMNGSFICANLIGCLLRSNLNIEFWSKVVKFLRMCVQMNMHKFGEHPNSLMQKNKATLFGRMAIPDYCVVRNQYQTSFDHGEVPTITFEDVLFGSVECRGRVQVLAWRSQIPPHKNHIFSCDIRKPRHRTAT